MRYCNSSLVVQCDKNDFKNPTGYAVDRYNRFLEEYYNRMEY